MASLIGLLEVISILVVRHEVMSARNFYEERNVPKQIVDELDAYLMEKENPEDPESPTVLDAFAGVFASKFFEAGKFSAMQAKSVVARTQNKFDKMVYDGIQSKMPPKVKAIQKVLDYLDIDIDIMDIMGAGELPMLANSLNKYGLGDLLKNDGRLTGAAEGVM
jgi:hypothetical protein